MGRTRPATLDGYSTSLVRHSALRVQRPTLLIAYHIEKTAGSTLMKWLHKQANAPARLTCLFDYMSTNCFFALYPELFPAFADAWRPAQCGTQHAPDWRNSSLAVEFHGYSKYRFWSSSLLGSQLAALRRMYAARGGVVVTTVSVREPRQHIVSSYHMWPPYVQSRSGRGGSHAVPLPEWLPLAVGLQAGSLTLSSSHQPKSNGWHNPLGCSRLDAALSRLDSFDYVGVLECTGVTLQLLGSALGWQLDESRLQSAVDISLARRPHGLRNGGVLWRESRRWQLPELNASVRVTLARAAACDNELYGHGRARMQAHLANATSEPLRSAIRARAASSSGCAALLPRRRV